MKPQLKPITFLGTSKADLVGMPERVRHDIGVELMVVQLGGMPSDFKPMRNVGDGAYEIRIKDAAGAFRAIYVAKFAAAIYVLHTFQKKTRATAPADIALAAARYKLIGA